MIFHLPNDTLIFGHTDAGRLCREALDDNVAVLWEREGEIREIPRGVLENALLLIEDRGKELPHAERNHWSVPIYWDQCVDVTPRKESQRVSVILHPRQHRRPQRPQKPST